MISTTRTRFSCAPATSSRSFWRIPNGLLRTQSPPVPDRPVPGAHSDSLVRPGGITLN